MKKAKWLIIPIMILTMSTPTTSIALPFSDVEEGDGHYVAINYLQEQGIIDGYEDNTFKSGQKINRAEALKMLTLASEKFTEEDFNNTNSEESPFIDTPNTEWYTKYLSAAKEKGIINGYEDGTFKPNQSINLVEALKIYLESYGDIIYPNVKDYDFADTDENDWYGKYVAYAGSRGMLDVTVTNEIWPTQEMTRGYLAEIIYRKKKFAEGYVFGKATFYGAAVQGSNTASGITFDMNKMTAAHKTLPFGTIVEVTNLANGKSVQVKITDRGPYGAGRVLDLSTAAFEEIAWRGTGVINVQYKVINENDPTI